MCNKIVLWSYATDFTNKLDTRNMRQTKLIERLELRHWLTYHLNDLYVEKVVIKVGFFIILDYTTSNRPLGKCCLPVFDRFVRKISHPK